MSRRLLSAVLLGMLMSATAHAGLRSSQVPVTGSALSAFFVSQGQTIDVANGQLDLGIMSVPALTNFQVQVYGPGTSTTSFGSYNAIPVSPTLYMIQPGASLPGSYELAAFKNSPGRLVVNQFDPGNALQGTNSYVGADPTAFGFFVTVTSGPTLYTQDSRNAGGAPRVLAYAGTGTRTGWTWFAFETGAGPGGDYADFIALVNMTPTSPVPVSRSYWGALKRLFR